MSDKKRIRIQKEEKNNFLSIINKDIFNKIAEYLYLKDIISFSTTCKRANKLSKLLCKKEIIITHNPELCVKFPNTKFHLICDKYNNTFFHLKNIHVLNICDKLDRNFWLNLSNIVLSETLHTLRISGYHMLNISGLNINNLNTLIICKSTINDFENFDIKNLKNLILDENKYLDKFDFTKFNVHNLDVFKLLKLNYYDYYGHKTNIFYKNFKPACDLSKFDVGNLTEFSLTCSSQEEDTICNADKLNVKGLRKLYIGNCYLCDSIFKIDVKNLHTFIVKRISDSFSFKSFDVKEIKILSICDYWEEDDEINISDLDVKNIEQLLICNQYIQDIKYLDTKNIINLDLSNSYFCGEFDETILNINNNLRSLNLSGIYNENWKDEHYLEYINRLNLKNKKLNVIKLKNFSITNQKKDELRQFIPIVT